MKKELGTTGASVGATVLACLFGGLALAIYPGWAAIGRWAERADAPAWVQAVGSILAILAAIGIAMWQRRVDHRTAKEREQAAAFLTAISLHNMLGPIVGTLGGVKETITSIRVDEAEARAKTMHRTLASLPLPTEDQLMTLHFVLPQVAVDLAIGCTRLSHAVLMIGLVVQSEDSSGDWALDRMRRLKDNLDVAHAHTSKARDALTAFIVSR
jgi:hypothetical protein